MTSAPRVGARARRELSGERTNEWKNELQRPRGGRCSGSAPGSSSGATRTRQGARKNFCSLYQRIRMNVCMHARNHACMYACMHVWMCVFAYSQRDRTTGAAKRAAVCGWRPPGGGRRPRAAWERARRAESHVRDPHRRGVGVLKQTFDQSADCCQSYVAARCASLSARQPGHRGFSSAFLRDPTTRGSSLSATSVTQVLRCVVVAV